MDRNPITLAMKRLLHTIFPDGLEGKSIIDLGCLEGGFSVEFARMGMNATGVEVRESNFRNCLFVQQRVDLPNLRFIHGDANDLDRYGDFDVFFVSGLLYHLDTPRAFLNAVERHCRKALILWTHVTQAEENEASRHYSLSSLTENEGLCGRWYSEYADVDIDELDALKWASWSNPTSFWLQKEYLLQILKEIGFDLVFEQFDCMDDIVSDMSSGFYHRIDRVLLAAIKSGLPTERRTWLAGRSHGVVKPSDRALREAAEAARDAAAARADALERELETLRLRLAALNESTSWRVTAPLRRLASFLRVDVNAGVKMLRRVGEKMHRR
jgi:SAM-dependent methyltransferase